MCTVNAVPSGSGATGPLTVGYSVVVGYCAMAPNCIFVKVEVRAVCYGGGYVLIFC